jgi:integrase
MTAMTPTQTTKTMVTKLQLPSGSWRIRIETATYEGKTRVARKYEYETVRDGEEAAELRRYAIMLERGAAKKTEERLAAIASTRATTPDAAAAAATFETFSKAWLERRLALKSEGQTERNYRALFRLYIWPTWGHMPLVSITKLAILDGFVALIQGGDKAVKVGRTGRRLSERTLDHVWSKLKAVLNDAADAGLFDRQQLNGVKKELPKPASLGDDVKALDDEQTQHLLKKTAGHYLGWVIRLALATGMRRGELCALQWKHVVFGLGDKATINVVESIADDSSTTWRKAPKTAASKRSLTVTGVIVGELRARREEADKLAEQLGLETRDQPVVLNAYGREYAPNTLTEAVREIMKKHGLGEFSLHCLRHTHASTLLRMGESIRAVSKRLGHSDPAFTLRIYTWALPREDETLALAMDRVLSGAGAAQPVVVSHAFRQGAPSGGHRKAA